MALNDKNYAPSSTGAITSEVTVDNQSSIDIFHALAKFLYAKRTPITIGDGNRNWTQIESHLIGGVQSTNARLTPTDFDPNSIIDRVRMNGEQIAMFLHENELDFVPNINAYSSIIDNLSLLDSLATMWDARNIIIDRYSAQISARSTIFYNYQSERISKYYPEKIQKNIIIYL